MDDTKKKFLEKEKELHEKICELIVSMAKLLRHIDIAKECARLLPLQGAIANILGIVNEVLRFVSEFTRDTQAS